jgi:hypothetical protein
MQANRDFRNAEDSQILEMNASRLTCCAAITTTSDNAKRCCNIAKTDFVCPKSSFEASSCARVIPIAVPHPISSSRASVSFRGVVE